MLALFIFFVFYSALIYWILEDISDSWENDD